MEETTEENNGDVLAKVKVTPGSDSFKVKGVNKWTNRLEIKLSCGAKNGEANEELKKKLEEILGKEVKIKTGHKSRKKIVLIEDTDQGKVKEKLSIEG